MVYCGVFFIGVVGPNTAIEDGQKIFFISPSFAKSKGLPRDSWSHGITHISENSYHMPSLATDMPRNAKTEAIAVATPEVSGSQTSWK